MGNLTVGRLWLAPMAGYTDIAFRELCRSLGAGLTVTEMVSVRGLVRDNAATSILTRLAANETPSCVQLFGNDPDEFARAAEKLDCDIIDINMGCPMPKIVKNGDGSALLNDPERAGRIVHAIVNACDKPVTVKTRLGYRMGEYTAAELIESIEKAGASAVTVHGRFVEQRYSGSSDVAAVKRVTAGAHIPVIYNGDVCAENIDRLLESFDGIAIGRAALGDPGIFAGKAVDPYETARSLMKSLSAYFDERYCVNQARKFFVHIFKGVKGGKALRTAVNAAQSVPDVLRALDKARTANV